MPNYRRLSDETYHPPNPVEIDPETGKLSMYENPEDIINPPTLEASVGQDQETEKDDDDENL